MKNEPLPSSSLLSVLDATSPSDTPPPGVDPQLWAGASFENTITEAIASAMDAQNITQEKLAERMGRTPHTIRRLLGGYQSSIADYGEALHVLGLRFSITIEPLEK